MKNKIIYLIPLLFLLILIPVNAYTNINAFVKVNSYSNVTLMKPGAEYYSTLNDDYFLNVDKYTGINYTYVDTIINRSQYRTTNYYFGHYLYYMKKYNTTGNEVGSVQVQTVGGTTPSYIYSSSFTQPIPYNSKVFYIVSYGNTLGGATFGIVDIGTMNLDCSVQLPFGSTGHVDTIIGVDEDYIYTYGSLSSGAGTYFRVYDYGCNIAYTLNSTQIPTYLGFNNFSHLANIFYDRENGFFVSLVNEERLITFDTSLTILGSFNISSTFDLTPNFGTLAQSRNNKCTYNYDNTEYSCIFYNGTNVNDIYLIKVQLNDYGDFGNYNIYNLDDTINIPGTDVYEYNPTTTIITNQDNNVYFQLHDTITTTEYHLFKASASTVNVYNGLVCSGGNCANQTGYCIPPVFGPDLTYYCTNVSLTPNGLPYCNGLEYQTFCSLSCNNIKKTNVYGVEYYTGVCLQNTNCTNECNTLYDSYSDTSSSYKYCRPDNVTGCLVYSGRIECETGESSIDGKCVNTTFSGGVGTLTGWSTTPLVNVAFTNDSNLKYTPIDYTAKSVNIQHTNSFVNLKFYTASTTKPYYLVRWCNYTTNTIYDSPSINTNYFNSDYVVAPNGYSNGIIELGFSPASNTGLLLRGVDSLERESFKYYIYRNSTLGICVYYPNETTNMSRLLGCINTVSDNVNKIVASIQTFENTNTIKMDVYTGVTAFTSYYGTLITKTDAASLTITKLNYSAENTTIRHLKITNDIQNENINVKLVNVTDDYTTNGCYFNSLGCRTVRSYYMNYDSSNWNLYNYKDWKICVTSLGGVALAEGDSSNGIFSNWTKQQKILFGLGVSIILFMIIIIFAMIQSYDDEKRPLIWIAIFVFMSSLMFFAIIKWVPVWIIIVPAILASLGVGIFFINKSNGGN
jgi:hypothetical protein